MPPHNFPYQLSFDPGYWTSEMESVLDLDIFITTNRLRLIPREFAPSLSIPIAFRLEGTNYYQMIVCESVACYESPIHYYDPEYPQKAMARVSTVFVFRAVQKEPKRHYVLLFRYHGIYDVAHDFYLSAN